MCLLVQAPVYTQHANRAAAVEPFCKNQMKCKLEIAVSNTTCRWTVSERIACSKQQERKAGAGISNAIWKRFHFDAIAQRMLTFSPCLCCLCASTMNAVAASTAASRALMSEVKPRWRVTVVLRDDRVCTSLPRNISSSAPFPKTMRRVEILAL
jgi:hypothetical protein